MRYAPVLVLLAHLGAVASAAAQPAKTPHLDFNGDSLPDGAIARLGTVRFQPPGQDSIQANHFRSWGDPVAVTLSPDGTALAIVHVDKDRTRIDSMATSTGKSVRQVELVGLGGGRVQFTPDGKNLVFSGSSKVVLIDMMSGNVREAIDVESLGWVSEIALTADGKWVAAQPRKAVYDAPVVVWETKTGKEVATLPGKGARCQSLAFGMDGKHMLLCSMMPTSAGNGGLSFTNESKTALACIDIKLRKIVGETKVDGAQFVALCPDGESVALEAADHQSVCIRHLPTGAERCVIPVKQAKFAFAPDGKVLLTVDPNGWAALWDTVKGDKIRDLDGALANKDFRIVGISKDGQTIAVLDGGWQSAAAIVVWNAATGKRVGRPPGHESAVTCIAYAPGGKMLASGSIDQTVRLWNPVTGEHLRELADHADAITAVAFSPDGKLLASSSKNGVIRLTNVADGKFVAAFGAPERGATALAFSPDNKKLFAGGHTPEVLGWEIASAKEVVRLSTGHDGSVMALASGGALAMTANGELRAEETPERLQVWNPMHKGSVASIAIRHEKGGSVRCDAAVFAPDGRMLASSQISTYEGIRPSYGAALLRVWERASGQPIQTLSPTITKVLAFSPNGRLLAAGGAGRSGHLMVGYGSGIDVWDTLTGQKAGALAVTPQCLAFSPDGLQLATGGRDHAILIWEAPKIQPRAEVKAPSAAQRDAWWISLGGPAKDAYQAMSQMIDAPEHAVAFLNEHVQPVRPSDPDVVAKLIAQLDSKSFAERMQAQLALEKMGEGAAHLIQQALERKVTLELGRRLEGLLRKCDATSTHGLQHHRAVATLEWIGTPAARAVLQTIADGAARAHLTVEAQAALKRLKG